MDPIATWLQMMGGGESAELWCPPEPKTYDPTATTDFAPNAPRKTTVKGAPDRRVDRLPAGCTATFTMATTSLPVGLASDGCTLKWRDTTWKIMSYRERYFRGQMNGLTLHLKG